MNATEKCALVMLTLGEEYAATVFKHLNTDEVSRVGKTMATLPQFSRQQLNHVLEEFRDDTERFITPEKNADEYLRAVLIRALGEEHAAQLLEELTIDGSGNGIEALNAMKPPSAAELLRNEHPQIVAALLVLLKRSLAAEILCLFDEPLRNDIMLRIATLGGIPAQALQQLTAALDALLSERRRQRSKMGGVRPAAEILNLMQGQQEESVINAVRDIDPALADKIVDEMFLFEDLLDLDDRSVQRILQEVEAESLVIALKGCESALLDKILNNMSQRQAEILREDLDLSAPVKRSRVDAERKNILAVVRRLADADEIMINKGGDSYV